MARLIATTGEPVSSISAPVEVARWPPQSRGAGARPHDMPRLHRRFQLIAASAPIRLARNKRVSALSISRASHCAGVLLGERDIITGRIASCAPSRLGETASAPIGPSASGSCGRSEPTSRPSQIASSARCAAAGLGAGRVRPALREHGVDRLQHCAKRVAHLRSARAPGTECGLAESSPWRATRRLRHRRRRDEKGRGDCRPRRNRARPAT